MHFIIPQGFLVQVFAESSYKEDLKQNFMKGRQLDSFWQPFQVPCRSNFIVLTKIPDNGKSK
jgi:hypothetical protein